MNTRLLPGDEFSCVVNYLANINIADVNIFILFTWTFLPM